MHRFLRRNAEVQLANAALAFLTLAIFAELLLPGYINGERILQGMLPTTVLPWTRNFSFLASLVCGAAWLFIARRDW